MQPWRPAPTTLHPVQRTLVSCLKTFINWIPSMPFMHAWCTGNVFVRTSLILKQSLKNLDRQVCWKQELCLRYAPNPGSCAKWDAWLQLRKCIHYNTKRMQLIDMIVIEYQDASSWCKVASLLTSRPRRLGLKSFRRTANAPSGSPADYTLAAEPGRSCISLFGWNRCI